MAFVRKTAIVVAMAELLHEYTKAVALNHQTTTSGYGALAKGFEKDHTFNIRI